MTDAHTLLKRYWGYDTFRPLQEEIVESVRQGHDTLVLLPTGGGKSLCYQMPALLREGICLVVSPLVALMKDQVQQLNDKGLKAACIVAGMNADVVTATLYNAMAGELKYLYVSPERLRQRRFIEHLRRMKVGLIAVDEAHCVSQWGYDFRPPYLQIADVRVFFPGTPLIALTATATPEVREDIQRHLLMHDCHTFQSSFFRPNLIYSVLREGDKTACMLRVIHTLGGSGIVYVRSRRLTQTVAQQLTATGITATYYHAGLATAERDLRQALWMKGECRVMVATNAFGMGIDKPDVRFVIHLDIPGSLEEYFQEAGRAGRDGQPSSAVLVCDRADDAKLAHDFETVFPSLNYIRNAYRALCNHYRLPLGSGADSRYDFDLEELCSSYNLKVREFYSACRFLEREGLIALPEREEAYSSLFIPVSRQELYRFQVDHMAMGTLLQTLLRLYPGLFIELTPIDEDKVASRCMMDASEVAVMLTRMHEMHVIDYRPRPLKPQVVFLSARVDEREILMNDTNYAQLKEAARRRMEAMRSYVNTDNVCRSRQLLAYFGEQGADCGECDVCRSSQSHTVATEEDVLAILTAGTRMGIHVLEDCLWKKGLEEGRDVVRRMLDKGTLRLDDDLYLTLNS